MLVAGCGGGDDSGSSSSTGATGGSGGSQVTLDANNYVTAAKKALAALEIEQQAPTLSPSTSSGLQQHVSDIEAMAHATQPMVGALATSSTSSTFCPGGGKIDITTNQAVVNKVSAGDLVKAIFVNCVQRNKTSNGAFETKVDSLIGTLAPNSAYDGQLTLTLTNFAVTANSATVVSNGSLIFAVRNVDATHSVTRLRSASYSASKTMGGLTETQTMTNLSAELKVDGGTLTTSLGVTLNASSLGSGSIGLTTEVPFVTVTPSIYPASGQLLIKGANGSQVRVTAKDNTTVLIDLDANGDGVFETRETRAWTQM